MTACPFAVRKRKAPFRSTARQMLLFRALGLAIPAYYHCELVRDEGGVRLAKRHSIGAIRIALEESSLRTALASGKKQRSGVVMKQGVQARGLKLLARDAREQAERAGIAAADYFCGIAQTGELTQEGLKKFLKSLPEGTTELMCHPGYADAALKKTATRLQDSRQAELEILTDTGVRNLVASQGIRLIDYGFVTQEA